MPTITTVFDFSKPPRCMSTYFLVHKTKFLMSARPSFRNYINYCQNSRFVGNLQLVSQTCDFLWRVKNNYVWTTTIKGNDSGTTKWSAALKSKKHKIYLYNGDDLIGRMIRTPDYRSATIMTTSSDE